MKRIILSTTLLMLSLTTASAEDNPGQFVSLMSQYLDLANQVVDVAEHDEAAIFLAIEGIFEIYEKRRDAPGAVKHLQGILDNHGSNRVVRNLVRFKLRDIYKETGEMDKALEQLDLIIKENAS